MRKRPAAVAQSVERVIGNDEVGSSNLPSSSRIGSSQSDESIFLSGAELPTSAPKALFNPCSGCWLQSSRHPAVRICPAAPKSVYPIGMNRFLSVWIRTADRICSSSVKCSQFLFLAFIVRTRFPLILIIKDLPNPLFLLFFFSFFKQKPAVESRGLLFVYFV